MKCARLECKAHAMHGDKFCFWHSPTTAERRRQAGRRGGSRGKLDRNESIATIDDIQRILAETISELRTDTSHIVSRGRAIGYIASILLTAIRDNDLERRISALEALHGK
jgi:hypothetical protein